MPARSVSEMQARKDNGGYWLILSPGEEVLSTISSWAKKEGIKGGAIWGIGGIKDATLGIYDAKSGAFARKTFPGSFELVSFSGNLHSDGVHAHAVISDASYSVKAGHFFSAQMEFAGEFFILPTDALEKTPLDGTSLKKIILQP